MTGVDWSVILAALGIGATHTVLGPDHYLPFVVLSRAYGWNRSRTLAAVVLCGLAHVVSSLLLATLGVASGLGVAGLERMEAGRGNLAAWALVAFGLAYAAWGIRRAIRRRGGLEPHDHGGRVHLHPHGDRPHEHPPPGRRSPGAGFWALLTIFVLGPCEPLIPLFVLPVSQGRWALAGWTALAFGAVTVALMAVLTLAGLAGLRRLPLGPLARWQHAMAGVIIAACGLSVLALGL